MSTIAIEAIDVNSYERGEIFEQLVGTVRDLTCEALGELINAVLDDEVTSRLQREPWACREASEEAQVPWACHRCGTTRASDLKRNGHYPRRLVTTQGSVSGLRVPMLRCTGCGAAANIEFAALRKHKRLWLDVEHEVMFAYGAEEGLRHIAQRVGRQLGWPVSASTIQARVHSLCGALDQWRERPITDPPDVLMVDGIWFTAVKHASEGPEGSTAQRRTKRVAIIVLGLWSETGRTEILDFEIAPGEDENSCIALLNRLHQRGVTEAHVQLIASDGAGGICAAIETVYPTVARQRCVFHKLRGVGENLCDKSRRKEILQAAAWIYDASNRREAHERLEQFVQTWEAIEPDAVSSLLTDFDASIAYLRPSSIKNPSRFRTTNAIEGGVMRPLRRTLDCATAYRSARGANVGFFLAIARLNASRDKRPWTWEASRILAQLHNTKP